MARIKPQVLARLQKDLGIGLRRAYQLIDEKVAETKLPRDLAAILVLRDNHIPFSKYVSPEELAIIRGSSVGPASISTAPPLPRQTRKVIVVEPIKFDLSFVSNKELIEILQRDISELTAAYSQGLSNTAKTCMILAGSITEALLLDCLLQNESAAIAIAKTLPNKSSASPEEWDLSTMVAIAEKLDLLAEDASAGASQLRKWRNLIHPGRELKDAREKRIQPTPQRAKSAIAFLHLVAEELAAFFANP